MKKKNNKNNSGLLDFIISFSIIIICFFLLSDLMYSEIYYPDREISIKDIINLMMDGNYINNIESEEKLIWCQNNCVWGIVQDKEYGVGGYYQTYYCSDAPCKRTSLDGKNCTYKGAVLTYCSWLFGCHYEYDWYVCQGYGDIQYRCIERWTLSDWCEINPDDYACQRGKE